MKRSETTYYLEMTSPDDLVPARAPSVPLDVVRAEVACPELNRYFYTAVGGDWFWIDRLSWTYQQWLDYLARPGLETWLGLVRGTPAGYFELDGVSGGDVELAYFGILPQFVGQGIGGQLLTAAVRRAWQKGATRAWVHTSSFDHSNALANYRARGFRLLREETAIKELPEAPPGPWPGAQRPNLPPAKPC